MTTPFIFAVGKIVGGEFQWDVAMPPLPEPCAPDGTLEAMVETAQQDTLWYEAELQELIDGREDEEFWRGGQY